MPTEEFFDALRRISAYLGGNLRQQEVAWGVIVHDLNTGLLIGVTWEGDSITDHAVYN